MDVKAKLRLALASLRDQAAIGKAVISAGQNNVSADIELAILRCTDRSDGPIDDCYVNELLFLVANAPGSAASLARKLSRRLDTGRDRVVALKTLLLLHRLLRGGDRRFELDIRDLYVSGELRLEPPSCSPPFLRRYAEFLEERMGWVINPAGKLEPVRPAPQRSSGERSPEGTLQRLSRCQTFLDRIMDCLPEETSVSRPDRVTQSALNILLRESFRVYASFCESFEAMAGSFPDFKNQRRDLARGIAKRAASQSLRLQSFYEACRRIVAGKNLDYPRVLVISMEDVSAMDGFLGGCPEGTAWRRLSRPGDSRRPSMAAPCHIKPVGTLGTVEEAGRGPDRGEEETGAGLDASPTLFSRRLETKISTEWVAFDDGEEVPVNLAGDDCSVESGKDLLLSWVVFDDR
ncbi:hypothetical protein Taro_047704 [Colocasia esculenta]|uniref:ENTH domain-containing protein n=1 Tax=Colocasia esculenta TaxID=4460 RepID=A0A843WW56_COLES|nr:hypothetical protein [Colocasia esculenta]